MAILIDLSQVAISGLQAQIAANKINVLSEDLCRHLILNSIRASVFKLKREYGSVIICCDSRRYWRKDVFPFYKFKRKKLREQSDFDWELVFKVLGELKEDIKNYFPYKLLEIDGAECDDIIGTLAPRLSAHEPVVIVSTDGDFRQLQKYPNVKQYNQKLGVFMKSENPELELKEKIIKGDSGDGICNCLSPSNSLAEGIRQKSITKIVLEKYMALDFNDPTIENYENIQRNIQLIDLSYTPKEIKDKIVEEYESNQEGSKSQMMKYFIEKKLVRLLDCLDEF